MGCHGVSRRARQSLHRRVLRLDAALTAAALDRGKAAGSAGAAPGRTTSRGRSSTRMRLHDDAASCAASSGAATAGL